MGRVGLNLAPSRQFLVHLSDLLRLFYSCVSYHGCLAFLLLSSHLFAGDCPLLRASLHGELVLIVAAGRVRRGIIVVGNFELP